MTKMVYGNDVEGRKRGQSRMKRWDESHINEKSVNWDEELMASRERSDSWRLLAASL